MLPKPIHTKKSLRERTELNTTITDFDVPQYGPTGHIRASLPVGSIVASTAHRDKMNARFEGRVLRGLVLDHTSPEAWVGSNLLRKYEVKDRTPRNRTKMKELILKEIKVLEQDLASFFYMVPVYWSYGKVVWELAHNLYLAPTSCTVMRLGGDEMVAEYALPAAFAVVHAREQYARNNHRYESYDYTQAQFNHYTWFCGDFAACDLPKHLRTL